MVSFKQKGQTLVETLVTVVFIAMAVLALIGFQNYLAYDNSLAQQRADATQLAEGQIETLKDFHVLNNTSGYTSYQGITSGSRTVTGTTTTFTITWTVTAFTNPTYKNIDVNVTWTDRNGASQSVRLITNVAGIDPSTSSTIM